MFKYTTTATAIALALSLQACSSVPGLPGLNIGNPSLSNQSSAKHVLQREMSVANAARIAGDMPTATRMYREIARQDPRAIAPRLALGDTLLASGATHEAVRAYQGALRINSSNYEALVGIGRAQLALNQPADALSYFEQAALSAPGDPFARNGRGVALDQLGRHQEAQAVYLSLLERDPSNMKVRNNYALSLALAGEFDDSTDIFTGLVAAPDAEARIRQNLALVYGLQGNDGQAAHISRADLDEDAVISNLKYFQRIRGSESIRHKAVALSSAPKADMTDAFVIKRQSSLPYDYSPSSDDIQFNATDVEEQRWLSPDAAPSFGDVSFNANAELFASTATGQEVASAEVPPMTDEFVAPRPIHTVPDPALALKAFTAPAESVEMEEAGASVVSVEFNMGEELLEKATVAPTTLAALPNEGVVQSASSEIEQSDAKISQRVGGTPAVMPINSVEVSSTEALTEIVESDALHAEETGNSTDEVMIDEPASSQISAMTTGEGVSSSIFGSNTIDTGVRRPAVPAVF